MNILLIGSGGREHAFAYKIAQSKRCRQLFTLPGNPGTAHYGINVPLDPLDFANIGKFCIDNEIKMIVVGPEEPLVKGMRNHFEADHRLKQIMFIGPGQEGAVIEGSKEWSKNFMRKYGIPTAAYASFNSHQLQEAQTYVNHHSLPVVLKADGLAAGKGVVICQTHAEAEQELNEMLANNKFGEAGNTVVIEEFLTGIEVSVFVVTDGREYIVLPEAKDYKRIGEGDTGPNTGGMGAVSPVPFADKTFMQRVEERIIKPTINGLIREDIAYKGFIFIGLMKTNDGDPYVIEYNCRMGDPETEVVLPRIQSDLVELLEACANSKLSSYKLIVDERCAATVVLVSAGYPGSYEKGKPISRTHEINDSLVFHAGTKLNEKQELLSNGGRVMAITSFGNSLNEAALRSLKNIDSIHFEGRTYRKDIGYEFA